MFGVTLKRDIRARSCLFKEVFEGFENVGAVRSIFGAETESVLSGLRVVIRFRRGYMRVDDETGSIMVSKPYLRSGDERYLYLDVIHELVHIRQYMEGKELFDRSFSYVDRPTEVEAYAVTVREAKRIGMTDEEIADYLRVEWITDEEFQRMLVTLGCGPR